MLKRLDVDPPGRLSRVEHASVFVLARMLASTSSRARKQALSRVDPLLRRRVVRRVEAALDDARRAAPTFDETDQRKLAILDLHDRLPAYERLADAELVRATFDRLAEPRSGGAPFLPAGPGLWSTTLGTVAFLAAVGAGVAAYFTLRAEPYAALHGEGEPTATAYARGGRPLTDPAVREAFANTIPELAFTAFRGERLGGSVEGELRRLSRSLRSAPLRTALGSAAYEELRRFAETYLRHVHGALSDADVRTAADRLNAALVRRGLGYRVISLDMGAIALGLATVEVRKVEFRRVGRERVSVLFAERLDRLNATFASFGHVERRAPFVIVPVDTADRAMTSIFLPLLDDPPAPSLLPAGTAFVTQPYYEPVHASAHRAVGRDLIRACGESLRGVGALLAERRHLIGQWSSATGSWGVAIAQPDHYQIDIEFYRRNRATNPRFRGLATNHDRLGERANTVAFACARDQLVESYLPGLAERYADERRTTPLPVPPEILDLADGYLDEENARLAMQPTVRSVRAALASLANSPGTASLTLTSLVRCWMAGGTCLRMDEDAARITFAELGRELGVPNVGNLRVLGTTRIAELYRDLVARDPAVLARAATAAHRRLFRGE